MRLTAFFCRKRSSRGSRSSNSNNNSRRKKTKRWRWIQKLGGGRQMFDVVVMRDIMHIYCPLYRRIN